MPKKARKVRCYMNSVKLMGRLTKDPEVRYTQGDNPMCIARYTLAVDRQKKKGAEKAETDFIQCVAFGRVGEFAEKYLKKGAPIIVDGSIQTGSYTNKEGVKVYTFEVNVTGHEFLLKTGDSGAAPAKGSAEAPAPAAQADDGFMDAPDEEELPFN